MSIYSPGVRLNLFSKANLIILGTVLYQFEHLGNFTVWNNDTTTMKVYRNRKYNVWEYHGGNLNLYKQHNVTNVTIVPYGYGRSLIYSQQSVADYEGVHDVPDTIDILFFGRLSPYRSAIIDAIKASGIQNVFVSDWLFGNVRDIAVKRAKIVLNLRYWGHDNVYESKLSRLIYLMANAKCIVSDPYAVENSKERRSLIDSVIFVKDRSPDTSSMGKAFADTIKPILQNYDICRKISHNAYLSSLKIPTWKRLLHPLNRLFEDHQNKIPEELCFGANDCSIYDATIQVQHFVGHSTWHSINLPSGPYKYLNTLELHDNLVHVPNITQISIYQSTKLVQNLLFRDLAKPIASIPLVYSSGRKSTMQVRFGENIDALSNLVGSSHSEKLLVKTHARVTLNHADTKMNWINVREGNDMYSNTWLYEDITPRIWERKVTIVFTTCKRLDKFLRTANALISSLTRQGVYDTKYIEDIVVIDDQSSARDRQKMKNSFPKFKFIFKESHQRGHAPSLNMILYDHNIVPSHINYVMYFEDDWLVDESGSRWFLDALDLLTSTRLHEGTIAQVLLDNRHGGWPFL